MAASVQFSIRSLLAAMVAENGLIVTGTGYFPYARFLSMRWNRHIPNTLVLSSPKHYVAQLVIPPASRDEVESFLTEKGLTLQQVDSNRIGLPLTKKSRL